MRAVVRFALKRILVLGALVAGLAMLIGVGLSAATDQAVTA